MTNFVDVDTLFSSQNSTMSHRRKQPPLRARRRPIQSKHLQLSPPLRCQYSPTLKSLANGPVREAESGPVHVVIDRGEADHVCQPLLRFSWDSWMLCWMEREGLAARNHFLDLVWTGLLDAIEELGYSFCFYPLARRRYWIRGMLLFSRRRFFHNLPKEGA